MCNDALLDVHQEVGWKREKIDLRNLLNFRNWLPIGLQILAHNINILLVFAKFDCAKYKRNFAGKITKKFELVSGPWFFYIFSFQNIQKYQPEICYWKKESWFKLANKKSIFTYFAQKKSAKFLNTQFSYFYFLSTIFHHFLQLSLFAD